MSTILYKTGQKVEYVNDRWHSAKSVESDRAMSDNVSQPHGE